MNISVHIFLQLFIKITPDLIANQGLSEQSIRFYRVLTPKLRNNNQTESRRHHSYSDQNDKYDTLMAEEDALNMVLANLEKEAVRKAIQALEPQQQELVMDIYFSGLSMADVARRDGVHKSSVTKRMNRVLEQLSKKLKKF